MNTIKKGSRGTDVTALQKKLGIAADGIFGADTERAVRAWQMRHGLTPDGIVGPSTWASLGFTMGRTIDAIIVHCTAGSQNQTARQVVDYHTRSKAAGGLGWNVPGYHYIVEPDGNVVNTLSEAVPSNGASKTITPISSTSAISAASTARAAA